MAYRYIERPSKERLSALCAAHPVTRVAAILGCDRATIYDWIRQYGGVPKRYRKAYVLPAGDALRQLCETNTDIELARRFGCSETTIKVHRHADGILRSRVRRRYTLDETFFKKIDTEQKAYILGFLAADGTIPSEGRSVVLMLHSRDEHILRDIRAAMGSNARIFKRQKIAQHPNRGPYSFIYFGSQKIVADLAKHGIGPRKSFTLEYPKTIQRKMERHFLRGLLDGDGTIRDRSFNFLGTGALIDTIIAVVEHHTGVRLVKYKADKLWLAVGCKRSKQVLHWLYQDATIFLQRKHHRFISHWG